MAVRVMGGRPLSGKFIHEFPGRGHGPGAPERRMAGRRHHALRRGQAGQEIAAFDRLAVGQEIDLAAPAAFGGKQDPFGGVADMAGGDQVAPAIEPRPGVALQRPQQFGHEGGVAAAPDEARPHRHGGEAGRVGGDHVALRLAFRPGIGPVRHGRVRRRLVRPHDRRAAGQHRFGADMHEARDARRRRRAQRVACALDRVPREGLARPPDIHPGRGMHPHRGAGHAGPHDRLVREIALHRARAQRRDHGGGPARPRQRPDRHAARHERRDHLPAHEAGTAGQEDRCRLIEHGHPAPPCLAGGWTRFSRAPRPGPATCCRWRARACRSARWSACPSAR